MPAKLIPFMIIFLAALILVIPKKSPEGIFPEGFFKSTGGLVWLR